MERMRMESMDIVAKNVEKIEKLFPDCIVRVNDKNGKLQKVVDFDKLKQNFSTNIVDNKTERYEFTWVGKNAAKIGASRPIHKTLRPCIEESKDWDNTENLYIEGDNLDVLKLLQNSYQNKVKIIYIDPPYNTGNDFIYIDDFSQLKEEYEKAKGTFDEKGNRLFKNTDTNGRFHSDWCSMMYSRLILAKNLLSDDGVIFISIDDNEQANLKKICDEVFGEENFITDIIWKHTQQSKNDEKFFSRQYNHILAYAKTKEKLERFYFNRTQEDNKNYKNIDNDPKGLWRSGDVRSPNYRESLCYDIVAPNGTIISPPPNGWRWSKETLMEKIRQGEICFKKDNTGIIRKIYLSEQKGRIPENLWEGEKFGTTRQATALIKSLFDGIQVFDTPKPIEFIKKMLEIISSKNLIILDFFSGSSTTAHAVMQLNAEDGGKRKFIMVQLPEKTDEKSVAFKAGYKDICEIGKERIRRAGEKIKEEAGLNGQDLDIGFRVLKLDDSNMKDVYYSIDEYDQQMLSNLEENIKEDRTDLDLLFGCLLDWGVELDKPYITKDINGRKVHIYNDGDLVACFEKDLDMETIDEIAKLQALRVVFRDSCFIDTPSKINVAERFKMIAPDTEIKVI